MSQRPVRSSSDHTIWPAQTQESWRLYQHLYRDLSPFLKNQGELKLISRRQILLDSITLPAQGLDTLLWRTPVLIPHLPVIPIHVQLSHGLSIFMHIKFIESIVDGGGIPKRFFPSNPSTASSANSRASEILKDISATGDPVSSCPSMPYPPPILAILLPYFVFQNRSGPTSGETSPVVLFTIKPNACRPVSTSASSTI